MPIPTTRLRTLTLERAPSPGRPAHVSAASGLVRVGEKLYVIADDENHLGIFPSSGGRPGSLARLLEGELPPGKKDRKRRKPDFESLALVPAFPGIPHGALLALGSCSTAERCKAVLLALDRDGGLAGATTSIDLEALREGLLPRVAPNIEGALKLGDELVLLQRGNRGDGRSYRIRLRFGPSIEALATRGRLDLEHLVAMDEVELGSIGEVPLSFSDGTALPDGRMAFTAIAEDTPDSYADGPCRGAAIGVLDRAGNLQCLEMLEPGHKPEGIEAWLEGREVRALLVTDADDPEVPAELIACALAVP